MKTLHQSPQTRALWFVLAAVVLIGACVTWWLLRPDTAVAPTNTSSAGSTVKITLRDGFIVHGLFTRPIDSGAVPIVILVHGFGTDLHDWDRVIGEFTKRHLAVLQYDQRGFGQSVLSSIPRQPLDLYRQLPVDLADVIAWARQQTGLTSMVTLVGTGFGSYVAAAAGANQAVANVLALSPAAVPGVFSGELTDKPIRLYSVASESEQAAVEQFTAWSGEPTERILLPTGSGPALIPLAATNIFSWISS